MKVQHATISRRAKEALADLRETLSQCDDAHEPTEGLAKVLTEQLRELNYRVQKLVKMHKKGHGRPRL